MTDIYEKIRSENLRKYGTHVARYGPTLLSRLYSDRAHFIYELIQNAEDACQRARKAGQQGPFRIHFDLYSDRLEVRHNGIPFDEADVRGICGLVEGTKSEDRTQIGKFGIGFKSVYAYTVSPEIYSGPRSFCIKDYVLPFAIPQKEIETEKETEETLFVIPFNHGGVTAEDANDEIEEKLKNLGLKTLLFINHIQQISWRIDRKQTDRWSAKVDVREGAYRREYSAENPKYVTLLYYENGRPRDRKEWLVFEASSEPGRSRDIRVAYHLTKDKSNKGIITLERDTRLFAFFETEIETHLRFLIHGHYNTTTSRDNIMRDDWNRVLIEQTGILVSEIIPKVKALGMLDVSFLNTLPIDAEHFTRSETMFKPIYEKAKEKLGSQEALLPTEDGGYIPADLALIGRGKDLRNLLSSEQLASLFNIKSGKWLDDAISEDKTPGLRKYLMEELGVEEIDPEHFAKKLNDRFMSEQSDEWVIQFYGFLLEHRALWRKKDYYPEEGPLRSKPIIRLENGSHTPPFNQYGRPLAYLASKDGLKSFFPIVKEKIALEPKAKQFLEALELREPDGVAAILEVILPKYEMQPISVSDEENRHHVQWMAKTLSEVRKSGDKRKNELLERIGSTPFLLARNIVSREAEYRAPVDIHIGENYIHNRDIEVYFKGNSDVWLLDERYKEIVTPDVLEYMGCNLRIKVNCRKVGYDRHVTLDYYHSYHKRGLDGFDPDCEIEGLSFALQNINLDRSKIIWQILKEYHRAISGVVESSSRQDFVGSTRETKFSKMGELLTSHAWLPGANGTFHKPSGIMLSELPDDFDPKGFDAQHIAQKLRFKSSEEEKLMEHLPQELRAIYERIRSASPKILQKIMQMLDAESSSDVPSPSVTELEEKMGAALDRPSPSSIDDNSQNSSWRGTTPEEEEQIRREYGKDFQERLAKRRARIRKEVSIRKVPQDGDDGNHLREFLLAEYDGHCQVCNTRLDLGPNKHPYFETLRLVESRDLLGWSEEDFNVLCLCPNCHALVKHGGRDFKNIMERAREISNGLVAPEEVMERGGDFYLVKVLVAGRDKEIFYTPAHMAKIRAFLDAISEDDTGE